MKTLDFITKKEGPSKIKLASQDLKRIWKMKQTKIVFKIYYRAKRNNIN